MVERTEPNKLSFIHAPWSSFPQRSIIWTGLLFVVHFHRRKAKRRKAALDKMIKSGVDRDAEDEEVLYK